MVVYTYYLYTKALIHLYTKAFKSVHHNRLSPQMCIYNSIQIFKKLR